MKTTTQRTSIVRLSQPAYMTKKNNKHTSSGLSINGSTTRNTMSAANLRNSKNNFVSSTFSPRNNKLTILDTLNTPGRLEENIFIEIQAKQRLKSAVQYKPIKNHRCLN